MLRIPSIPPYEFIQDEDSARRLLARLDRREIFAVDTETTGLNIVTDQATHVAIGYEGYRCLFPAEFLPLFKGVLENPLQVKIWYQLKFDYHMISNASGIVPQGGYDALVMARMEDNDRRSQSLKDVTASIFSPYEPEYVSYETPFRGKLKNIQDFIEKYGLEAAADYGSLDAWNTWNVFWRLRDRLMKRNAKGDKTLWDLFVEEEVPYSRILFDMERRGFLLDLEFLEGASKKADKECDRLAYEFNKLAGKVVDLRSTKQVGNYFYEVVGKRVEKLTAKAQKPSVDVDVMQKWADEGDKRAKILLEFRKIDKMNGTYIKGLLKRVDSMGRVHTTFNQGGAQRTFRLSSSDPNLQNIKSPGEDDMFMMRKAFIASEGTVLADSDYDQLELMLIADFAQETTMMEAIAAGRDLHSDSASLMFGVPYEDVVASKKKPGEERNDYERGLATKRGRAKNLAFGLNYGEGPKKFSHDLRVPEEEAYHLIDLYFKARPKLKDFMDACSGIAEHQGYVKTVSGRWLMLKLAMSDDWGVRKGVSKDATNRIIQGSAADVTRLAMLYCDRSDVLKNCGASMLSQVHDELIFECPDEHVEEARVEIKRLMELPYKDILDVSLSADPGVGPTWYDAKS